ncbi:MULTISPECIES: AfsR/SARP family transcriptional regulator [unclassified Saccharothrix]|uniref:AfsR/SARP family transcriptional regulator n=1 Tax=unclassified Saccharothrix TaxID=2593673 RepID=UPI00307CDD61
MFTVLGSVAAYAGGRAADVGHARQQCVLVALLVDAGSVVPQDALVDRVWGPDASPRARNTLHTYVARLRRALPPGAVLERRSGGYRLVVDAEAVDLHRFRALTAAARSARHDEEAFALLDEALGLWRGEAFAGLDTPWLTAVRTALDSERAAAELDHADLALRLGRHDEVLPRLLTRAQEHPLDERLAAQLITALYRAGRQADALGHYDLLRRTLADELGADPGPALRELHRQVLTADPALDRPTGVPVPRQLPSPPRLFTGRDDDLARLTKALDAGDGVPVSVVGGAGGIGKTWLALHWAHQHVDRFPDGQLHVNLRGFAPAGDPVPPSVAVRGFLDALGVPASAVPADPDAQSALYRSLVAGRRLLVVLDNAADSAQVAPLLPGSPTCAVVVTSRRRLPGLVAEHGAHTVELDVLDDAEARDLLARHLGADRVAAEPEAVAELLARCAGLPLALAITAARAAAHPSFPLAVWAAELRSAGLAALDTGETALDAVFSWSYRALPEETAAVFRLLGVVPGPDVSLSAAASLTGLPRARVAAVLRELTAAHLVQQHAPDRFRLHDLLRLYAAERAAECPDSVAGQRRLVDFYLHTAFAMVRVTEPYRLPIELDEAVPGCVPDQPAGDEWEWFAAEHQSLLAVQRLAAERGWHKAVWQLAWTLDDYHFRQGLLADEYAVWQAGAAAAEVLSDHDVRTRAHRLLGYAADCLGRRDEALSHLRQALALAERADDLLAQAHTHYALARTLGDAGDPATALHHSEQSLALYRRLDDEVGVADALNAAGWHATHLGGHEDRARTLLGEALDLYTAQDNTAGVANTLDSLATLAHRTGRHADARDHYERALALLRELGHSYEEANTLERLGHVLSDLGEPAEARRTWREALRLHTAQHRTAEADRVRTALGE